MDSEVPSLIRLGHFLHLVGRSATRGTSQGPSDVTRGAAEWVRSGVDLCQWPMMERQRRLVYSDPIRVGILWPLGRALGRLAFGRPSKGPLSRAVFVRSGISRPANWRLWGPAGVIICSPGARTWRSKSKTTAKPLAGGQSAAAAYRTGVGFVGPGGARLTSPV